MSLFLKCLKQQQFCILLEYLCSHKTVFSVPERMSGFPVIMTLADRVHTDEDPAPLDVAQTYPKQIDKILHFAGKGRDIKDLEKFLDQAKNLGQRNLLLLTGDKLKNHQFGDSQHARTRYLESVNAVMTAKNYGFFNIGVAFNPFKYAESEKKAQYLKLHKKIKAGADYIITQLGFDLSAYRQVKNFLNEANYAQPILACVMPLTLARAQFMVKQNVAGIVITPHVLEVLKYEKTNQQLHHVYMRCALQVLICQHLGFAGVHLSACHKQEEQDKLTEYLEQYRHLTLQQCEALWYELWKVTDDRPLQPDSTLNAYRLNQRRIFKYQSMHFLHDALFSSKVMQGIGAFIFKSAIWQNQIVENVLIKTEHFTKHSLLGCESCGQCRLGETLYICPETCPKGLANGPCGGTRLDRCEFEDRECIHSVKARLAQVIQQTQILKETLIETVPIEVRGSSSWRNWYLQNEA